MLLGVIAGAMYSGTVVVEQRSTAVVYFAVDRAKTASDYTAGNTFAQSVMPSFAQIVKSPIVLDPVIEELDLKTTAGSLAGRMQVNVPSNTAVMNVTVIDTTSLRAAMTANAVIRQLDAAVRTLSPRGELDSPAMRMSSVSPAVASDKQPTLSRLKFELLGGVAGLLVALVLVAIWESLTRPIRSAADAETTSSTPVLATVAFDGDRVAKSAHGNGAEGAVGTLLLHTNIAAICERRGDVKSVSVVPVTASSDARAVAVDLAMVSVRARNRILLVDADLRAASVAGMIGLQPTPGLSEILQGTARFGDVLQQKGGLDFVAAGSAGGAAAELLVSSRLNPFLAIESARYQMLLVVGGAALPVADGATLSAATSLTILVARCGHTKRRDLVDAVERLSTAGGTPAGVILVQRRSFLARAWSSMKDRTQKDAR